MRKLSASAEAYSRQRQTLHWIGALLILAIFAMGFTMARTDSEALRATLYAAHATAGILIVVTSLVRIVLARRRPTPPPPGMPRWNEIFHQTVHNLALIVPLILALSGIGAMVMNGLLPAALQPGAAIPATLGDARAQTAHRLIAWSYLALLALHVAGVMRHQFTKGDVMRRMGVRGFPTKPVPAADKPSRTRQA
jgi:cytochrome b561